jgi:Flp pilus assembly protein TadD
MHLLLLGWFALGAGAGAMPAPDGFAETDRLYFSRDHGANLEDSIALLEARLRQEPSDPALLWRLGRSLLRLGERRAGKAEKLAVFTRAEDVLRRAVSLAPRDAAAHYWLGLAMGRRGETRGMLRSLFLIGPLRREMQTVLELDPKNAGAHHVLGEMWFEIPAFAGGDKRKAVKELTLATQLEPNDSSLFTDLAEACLAVGERDQAKAALEHVLAIKKPADPPEYDGDAQEARRMLKKIR